jgi:enterochelin esterase-like enzyme
MVRFTPMVVRTRRPESRRAPAVRLLIVASVALPMNTGPAEANPTDACPATPHRFESFALFAPSLERLKRILVYLPPGYDCAPNRRYPVFYLNDGHDLFDWNPFAADLGPALAAEIAARKAWYGSWHLESQLDHTIATGSMPPVIVVGIAADDGLRSRDLAPVPWAGSAEARGIAYGRFVAETVVPAVDGRFRTIAERRCRGIGGASLGGVSALQIGLAHPADFAMVLALSPVLADPALADYLGAAWADARGLDATAVLVDFDDDAVGTADRARFAALIDTGTAPASRPAVIQTPGGRHRIASWAERVLPALRRLLAARCPR